MGKEKVQIIIALVYFKSTGDQYSYDELSGILGFRSVHNMFDLLEQLDELGYSEFRDNLRVVTDKGLEFLKAEGYGDMTIEDVI